MPFRRQRSQQRQEQKIGKNLPPFVFREPFRICTFSPAFSPTFLVTFQQVTQNKTKLLLGDVEFQKVDPDKLEEELRKAVEQLGNDNVAVYLAKLKNKLDVEVPNESVYCPENSGVLLICKDFQTFEDTIPPPKWDIDLQAELARLIKENRMLKEALWNYAIEDMLKDEMLKSQRLQTEHLIRRLKQLGMLLEQQQVFVGFAMDQILDLSMKRSILAKMVDRLREMLDQLADFLPSMASEVLYRLQIIEMQLRARGVEISPEQIQKIEDDMRSLQERIEALQQQFSNFRDTVNKLVEATKSVTKT